jgi:MFS family permease
MAGGDCLGAPARGAAAREGAAAASRALLTRPFALCALANFAQGLAFNLFLHFPGFLHAIGASDVQIGLLFGLTGLTAIGARPPIGRVMDTRGRLPVIHLGNALNVVAMAGYLGVSAIGPLVYAVRIVHGLAEAMLFTALFTYAADCVPSARRTQGLALFGVSGMLPIGLAGLIGDAILARAGYRQIFLTSAVLAVAAAALALPLREARRAAPDEEPARGFRSVLGQSDLRPLWWIVAIFAIALASVFTFLKRYVDETGLGTVGSFFSAYSGAAIALRLFLGWLPDRIGPKRVLFPALGCLATAFALLAGASGTRDVVIAGVLFGVGHGFAFPILFGIAVTRARDADRGSAMGIYTALFDAGVVIGGPLFGAVVAAAGFPAMFATAGGVVTTGALVFLAWDGHR